MLSNTIDTVQGPRKHEGRDGPGSGHSLTLENCNVKSKNLDFRGIFWALDPLTLQAHEAHVEELCRYSGTIEY